MCPAHCSDMQLLRFDDGFDGQVRQQEPMAKHTTYRIGGPAAYFAEPDSITALSRVLDACAAENLEWTVVGRGSNLLVADSGYDGVIISLGRDFKKWHYDQESCRFTAGSAVMLSRIVQESFGMALSGFEFAVGTPGTLGGALRMNAGTGDDWIGSRVRSVITYQPGQGLVSYHADDIEWNYRNSSLPSDQVVVECVLDVTPGSKEHIRGKMEGALARRKRSQPLDASSCGSVFRNPEGNSAGKLIEDVGLKGQTQGGACISEKHANFIINTGGATAEDVMGLIRLAQTKVNEAYGIELQPEVRFLGFE